MRCIDPKQACAIALRLLLLPACSLVTLESKAEPLPPQDLQARLMTRELATFFADRVQLAVERISSATEDTATRSAALRWQIASIGACRRASLRQDPREALVDVWGLSLQQRDFLTAGAGSSLFGAEQSAAVGAAEQLVDDVERVVRATTTPAVRGIMEQVVHDYAERFPIASLDFAREPILPLWIAAASDVGRVTTVGSSPEVMQDVADRIRILGEGVPEALAWRTELALTEHEEELADLQALLERLDAGLADIAALAEKSPELAATAARELQRELAPSIAALDARWGESRPPSPSSARPSSATSSACRPISPPPSPPSARP